MITQCTKDRMVDQCHATLDGDPAVIRGRLNRCATVANAQIEVEYSWEAAMRIVDTRDGAFTSGLSRAEKNRLAHKLTAQGR